MSLAQPTSSSSSAWTRSRSTTVATCRARYAVSHRDYERGAALFAPRTDTASGAWVSALTGRWGMGPHRDAPWRRLHERGQGRSRAEPASRCVYPRERLAFLGALLSRRSRRRSRSPFPAVGYRGLPGGLAFAYQKSAGVEVALPLTFTLRTIGFHPATSTSATSPHRTAATSSIDEAQNRAGVTIAGPSARAVALAEAERALCRVREPQRVPLAARRHERRSPRT